MAHGLQKLEQVFLAMTVKENLLQRYLGTLSSPKSRPN